MVMICPGAAPAAVVIIISRAHGHGRLPREGAEGRLVGFMWKTAGRDMRGQRGGEIGHSGSMRARFGKTLPGGSSRYSGRRGPL